MTTLQIGQQGTARLKFVDAAGNVIEDKDLPPLVEPVRFYTFPADLNGPTITPLGSTSSTVNVHAGSNPGVYGLHATAKFHAGFPGIEIATEMLTITAPGPLPVAGQIEVINIRPE